MPPSRWRAFCSLFYPCWCPGWWPAGAPRPWRCSGWAARWNPSPGSSRGGYSSALTAFTGQNYGAGKWGRIHKGYRISLIAMCSYGAFITALLFFFGRQLFGVFLPDPDTILAGAEYLRILSLCQMFNMLEAISAGAFRGMGKTIPPSVSSITMNGLRVPLAYLLASTSLGLTGVWWGVTIGAMLRGSMVFIWYLLYCRNLPKQDIPMEELAGEVA
ncbi:hypothetical protein LJC20_02885 [Eubacteriales bacterium OttesenSCG-928-M02]|nr:hypothetical protein [Eubacteriales bacterium OttesenSCG-928-M02]